MAPDCKKSGILDDNERDRLNLILSKAISEGLEIEFLHLLYIVLPLLEVDECNQALHVVRGNFILNILIYLSCFVDLELLFFEQSIFDHIVNDFILIRLLDLVLKLRSSILRILQMLLNELNERDPKVLVLVKRD